MHKITYFTLIYYNKTTCSYDTLFLRQPSIYYSLNHNYWQNFFTSFWARFIWKPSERNVEEQQLCQILAGLASYTFKTTKRIRQWRQCRCIWVMLCGAFKQKNNSTLIKKQKCEILILTDHVVCFSSLNDKILAPLADFLEISQKKKKSADEIRKRV